MLRKCLEEHIEIRLATMARELERRMDHKLEMIREKFVRDQAEILLIQQRHIDSLERRLLHIEEPRPKPPRILAPLAPLSRSAPSMDLSSLGARLRS